MSVIHLKKTDCIIVGPRYRNSDLRVGANETFLLEVDGQYKGLIEPFTTGIEVPKPVAGTIIRFLTQNDLWAALCEACYDHSKQYVRRCEPAMFRWAHNHRCRQEKTS